MTAADVWRAAAAREGSRLIDAAALDLGAPVPRCHGWTTTDLLDHVAGVLRFVTSVVVPRTAPTGRPEPRPAEADPVTFARAALDDLVAALADLPPEEPVWNWSATSADTGDFWLRRMAQELLVHRIDAEQAVGDPTPVDPDLAADGVDEMLTVFVPRIQGRTPFVRLAGSLHLHRTDGPGEWLVEVTSTTTEVRREHAKGEVAVRGTAVDLLLAVWGRHDFTDLEVIGESALLEAWAEEVRA